MNYKGTECVSCGKKFNESDDIVVCPECGSPHHRECYKTAGKCANIMRHDMNFNWNNEKYKSDEINNNNNTDEENKDTDDNNMISMSEFIEKNIKDINDEIKDGCTLGEALSFVNRNVLYYASIFARIRKFNVNTSLNLTCFIFPQIYFANRKMWFWAILTSVINVILLIPMMMALLANDVSYDSTFISANVIEAIRNNSGIINSLMEICNGADLVMRVLFCLFGNRLYYNFVTKSIRRMKLKNNGNVTKEQLAYAGGTSFANVILILVITFAMIFGLTFFLQYLLPIIF